MRRKLFLQIFVLMAAIVMVAGYLIYNKPHRNILAEEAQFSLPLAEMNQEFLVNEDAAYKKYFNKVVEISGTAVSINEKANKRYDIVLKSQEIIANGELIYADDHVEAVINKEVLLKGLFIGYDNLLEEIKLSECSIKQASTD